MDSSSKIVFSLEIKWRRRIPFLGRNSDFDNFLTSDTKRDLAKTNGQIGAERVHLCHPFTREFLSSFTKTTKRKREPKCANTEIEVPNTNRWGHTWGSLFLLYLDCCFLAFWSWRIVFFDTATFQSPPPSSALTFNGGGALLATATGSA
jgi:hypothetical protein